MKATIKYDQTNWIIRVSELNIYFNRTTSIEAVKFCRLNELEYTFID